MARVLVVGCGCRGRALAAALVEEGHAVRGTTRSPGALGAIEAVGGEARLADPARLGTIAAQLEGASVLCWLLGTASGQPDVVAALHGPRLASLLDVLVDTPVRGVVYEAGGTVDPELLESGARLVRGVGERHRMPVAVLGADPVEREAWLAEARAGVRHVLE